MQIEELIAGVGTRAAAVGREAAGVEIAAVAYDSRTVTPGALFVAIRGGQADGNRFVGDALARGAVAVASAEARPAGGAVSVPAEIPWIRVEEPRQALATIAANFYGRPADGLELVGITGTNGKTTTSFLV